MKYLLLVLVAILSLASAVDLKHLSRAAEDVECSGFDTFANCPGGWPAVEPDEAKHRVKCCGMADAGRCAMCNRCKGGSFADGCCTCDDDELVDKFWHALHLFHHNGDQDNSLISERQLINIIADVKGDMDTAEELKIKDVYENILTHLVPDAKKSSSGLAYLEIFIRALKDNEDIVQHLLGETESPAEGTAQLAFDHTKAITPEWFKLDAGGFGDNLPPPVVRLSRNGLWEAKVPNFEHPEHGYYPSVYKHTAAEAKAYVNEKKAEALELYAKKQEWEYKIQEKAAENTELATGGKYKDRDYNGDGDNFDKHQKVHRVLHQKGQKRDAVGDGYQSTRTNKKGKLGQ